VGDPILSKDQRTFTQAFNAAGQQTNAAFWQYTATANPRQLQLALRITF
jgi:hypothetical protein